MTLSELLNSVRTIIEEDMFIGEWKDIVNLVLKDLNPYAKLLTLHDRQLSINQGVSQILLSDIPEHYETISVQFEPYNKRRYFLKMISAFDNISEGWFNLDGMIMLNGLSTNSGRGHVTYYKKLTMTQEDNDEVFNLPEKYHNVLLKGVLSAVAQKEEEHERKQDFFQDYYMARQTMLAERILEVEPWSVHVARRIKEGA